MIMEAFSELLPSLRVEGVEFVLQIINNGSADDNRLVYAISYVETSSRHYKMYLLSGSWENPLDNDSLQGFLFLRENIETDEDMVNAIADCKEFLNKNNLL